ncbi:hypothetical protein BofuT4_uP046380.1 [Botrytis cinerea T4]|uniref:Uncharacterized protein n=1 Tax=Botryotinia fuckeliana (strain T4) TaxID=999810 RepID=G2XYT3_BOTF4|nr:hypothetical protein BofuT4_uP046380.1 [Botrytis cinerea T4]
MNDVLYAARPACHSAFHDIAKEKASSPPAEIRANSPFHNLFTALLDPE